jgi:hypothetical protein
MIFVFSFYTVGSLATLCTPKYLVLEFSFLLIFKPIIIYIRNFYIIFKEKLFSLMFLIINFTKNNEDFYF